MSEIVTRQEPPPPWWALNRAGLCYLSMGNPQGLSMFERALACTPDRRAEGSTLGNLGQVFDARGDYDSAQRYLELSLAIQREIGDKEGENSTLNSLSHVFMAAGTTTTLSDALS